MKKLTESQIRREFQGVKFQRIDSGTVLLVKHTTDEQYEKLKAMENQLEKIFDVEIVNFT